MKKWEYKSFTIRETNEEGCLKRLNMLGQKGWELVYYQFTGSHEGVHREDILHCKKENMICKREIYQTKEDG